MVTCKHAVNLNIDAFNGTNDSKFLVPFKFSGVSSVADPDDLQIGEGGGGGLCHKFFFRPFEPQFGLKIRVGRGMVGPSPRSATEVEFFDQHLCHFIGK